MENQESKQNNEEEKIAMQTAEKPKKKIKLIPMIIIAVCVLLLVITFIGVKASKKNKEGGFGGRGMQQGNTAVSVRTTLAKNDTLHDYVNTNGEIQAQSSIDVFPDIGGKIVDVRVTLGSQVKRGDAIAEVDPSAPGTQYKHSIVTAPISGTITRSPLKPGTTVNVSTAITVIGDVNNLQITANIPERYVASLKTGLKADIILEAYPEEKFSATVARVSPLVDSNSRTKEIILNFDKKDSRINAGMFAKVKLWTQDYSNAITIPTTAIVEKNDKQYIYIIKEDKAELREVKVGKAVDDKSQLISGVEEGERMVIEGMRVLSNGASVNDIDSPKAESKTEEAE